MILTGRTGLTTVAIVVLAIVALAPLALMFGATCIGESGSLSLSDYSRVLIDSRQWVLLGRSLQVGLATTAIALLIGVPLAFLTARTDLPGRRLFSAIYAAPLFIPPYIMAICWRYYVGDEFGVHDVVEGWLGLSEPLWKAYGFALCSFYMGLALFPLVTLLTRASLRSADPSLEEQALLSRGGLATALRVSLPLALPGVLTGATFVFLFALSEFGVPNMLMINTYAVEVLSQYREFKDIDAATASSVPLVFLCIVPLLVARSVERSRRFALTRTDRPPFVFSLGRAKAPALLFVIVVVLLAIGVPVVSLLVIAGPFRNYREAIALTGVDFLNSIVFALSAATLTAVLAFALAYGAARARSARLARFLDLASILPFAFPAGVLAIGYIRLWNRPGLFNLVYAGGAIMVLGFAGRLIPFAFRSAATGLKAVPAQYEEAAETAGVGFVRRLVTISGRLSLSGILAGWIVVFVLSLGELGMSILIAPAGSQTLPLRIFNMIHFNYNSYVAALCLLLIGLGLLPVLIYVLAAGRSPEVR